MFELKACDKAWQILTPVPWCVPGTALGPSQATGSVSISTHTGGKGGSPILGEELYQRPPRPVHTCARPPQTGLPVARAHLGLSPTCSVSGWHLPGCRPGPYTFVGSPARHPPGNSTVWGTSLAESRLEASSAPSRLQPRAGTAASPAQRTCESRRSVRPGTGRGSGLCPLLLVRGRLGLTSALGTMQSPHVTKWSKQNTEHGCVMARMCDGMDV